jgi:tRNA pseudouridine13 synthase
MLMNMKIKVKPEDFVVNELTDFPINKTGAYHVYRLEKRLWNTMDALSHLARLNNITMTDINYGGKKDRYAHTFQYLTVKDKPLQENTNNENLIIKHLGRANEAFGPKFISGNKFDIVIRDLKKEDAAYIRERLADIQKYGFANYFGDQRFGSYDKNLGFFTEKFLKAHYSGALQCLLCSIYSEDKKEEKERKKNILAQWGDFKVCMSSAKTVTEKRCFELLIKKSKAFLNCIHLFPPHEIGMYFSAYQGYLWNIMLAKLIEKNIENKVPVSIKEWQFQTYRHLSEPELTRLKSIKLPVPGIRPYFPDDMTEKIYDETLREADLHQGRFSLRHYRKAIIKSFPREAIVIPQDLKILNTSEDELYPMKHKLALSFILPRGCFATMLLKHVESGK